MMLLYITLVTALLLLRTTASGTLLFPENNVIYPFLTALAALHCQSPSGNLLVDQINQEALNLPSLPYDTVSEAFLKASQQSLGKYIFGVGPDPSLVRPLRLGRFEAVRMLKACQAQEAIFRIFIADRTVPADPLDACVAAVSNMYYGEPVDENANYVWQEDGMGAIQNASTSSCALQVLNAAAFESISLLALPSEPSNAESVGEQVIELGEFPVNTEWIHLNDEISRWDYAAKPLLGLLINTSATNKTMNKVEADVDSVCTIYYESKVEPKSSDRCSVAMAVV